MKELKLDVFGRVQGVGFRQFVKRTADSLGIVGLVQNMPDGRVSVIAQGSRSRLTEFLTRVQKGSFFSKVAGMTYGWRDSSKGYSDFVIAIDRPFISDQQASFANLGKNLLQLQKAVPRHVAVIPDGNRRWAKERGLEPWEGHKVAGSKEHMVALLKAMKDLDVRYFSLWVFSTENWDREKREVDELFSLFVKLIDSFKDELLREHVRFRHLGRKDRLPASLSRAIDNLEDATAHFTDYHLQLCLDYGGRDELARAINKILKSGVSEVTEQDISRYLDTEGIPDPDLIIRTSGEHRMSGFMPYQGTYAEYYFTSVHFPDFGPEHLQEAVEEFARRKRNFGK